MEWNRFAAIDRSVARCAGGDLAAETGSRRGARLTHRDVRTVPGPEDFEELVPAKNAR